VQQAESTASKTKSDVENQSRATIQKAEEYAKLLEKEVAQQLGAVRIAHESLLDLLQKSQVANEKAQASVVAAIEVLNQKSAKNIKVEPKS
jgi:hypothetical protein